jgi:hypothetical protein
LVIEDDQIKMRVDLSQHAVDALLNIRPAISYGQYDAEFRQDWFLANELLFISDD